MKKKVMIIFIIDSNDDLKMKLYREKNFRIFFLFMCPKLIFNLSQVEKIFFRLMFPGFSSSSSVCVYVMDNLLQDIIIFFFEKKKGWRKWKKM